MTVLRCDWCSASPELTSQMTSPVRHISHQQQVLTRRNIDGEDETSLSTPPLPVTSELIKAEPVSPSVPAAARHRHVTSGQGHRQGQSQTHTAPGVLSRQKKCSSGDGKRGDVVTFCGNAEAASMSGQGRCQGYLQGQTPVEGYEASSAGVLTSLLGNDTAPTSPLSAFTAATSVSSSVFESDVAKHARLEVSPCATDWQPLD